MVTYTRQHVSPDLAKQFLEKNTRNRSVREAKVDKYARMMKQGHWNENHQGIAFDVGGNLIDGQHRLMAIVKSGIGQWMPVCTGLPENAIMGIDQQASRSASDNFKIMGYEQFGTNTVATARAMLRGPFAKGAAHSLDDSDLLDFIKKHSIPLAFVKEHPGSLLCHSAIASVLARAYYHTTVEVLARFRYLVKTGPDETYVSTERAAIALREHLIYVRANKSAARGSDVTSLYRKVQRALRAFIDGQPLSKVYESEQDLFPLPQ